MDDFILSVFLSEIGRQCRFAAFAAKQVNAALVAGNRSVPLELQTAVDGEVMRGLHSLLTHAANVSKLLWPPAEHRKSRKHSARQQRAAARAAKLRSILSLPEAGHILQHRTLRDHLDHFDERLDDWAATSPNHVILSDMIGSPDTVEGVDPLDRMRTYDPRTQRFIFRGEEFNIQAIVTALGDLLRGIETHLATPFWEWQTTP